MSEQASHSPNQGITSVDQYMAARDQLHEAGYGSGVPTIDALGRPHGAGGEFLSPVTADNASAVAAVNERSQADSLALHQAASATHVSKIPKGIFTPAELRAANTIHSNPNDAARHLEALKQRAAKMAAETDAAKALHGQAAEVYRSRRMANLDAEAGTVRQPIIDQYMADHAEKIRLEVEERLRKMTVTGAARDMAAANIRAEIEELYRKQATALGDEAAHHRKTHINGNGGIGAVDAINARDAERAEAAAAQRVEDWKQRMGVGGRGTKRADQQPVESDDKDTPQRPDDVSYAEWAKLTPIERRQKNSARQDVYPEGWSKEKVEEMLDSPIFAEITAQRDPELYEQVMAKYQRDAAKQSTGSEGQQARPESVESALTRPNNIPFKTWLGMSPADRREAVRALGIVDNFDAARNDGSAVEPMQAGARGVLLAGSRDPAAIPKFYGLIPRVDAAELQQAAESTAVATDPTPTPAGGIALPQQPNGEAPNPGSLTYEADDPDDGRPSDDVPTPGAPEAVAEVAGKQPGDAATAPITIEPAPQAPEPKAPPTWDPDQFSRLMNPKAHKPEAAAPDATTTQVLTTVDSAGGLANLAKLMDEQQGQEGSRKRHRNRIGKTAIAVAALLFAGSGIAAVANLWGGPDGNSDKVSVSDQVSGVSNPAPAPSSKAPRHRA